MSEIDKRQESMDNALMRAKDAQDKLYFSEKETREAKAMVQKLYGVIVRALVIFKQLIRLGAVGGVYMWVGKREAIVVAFFLLLQGLMQLAIDKTRQVVHPELKLSEWDVDF